MATQDKDISKPANKGFQAFAQPETAYTTLSGTTGQACANCRFFRPGYYTDGYDDDSCQIVEDYPEPILPTGWCDQWFTRKTQDEVNAEDPLPVVIVEEAAASVSDDVGLIGAIKALFGKPATLPAQGFKLLSGNPDYDWIAWYTNNFEDREKQIIAEHAIADYVERVEKGLDPYPELWFFHIPGSKHGQATKLFQLGHFALALGRFDTNPIADGFKSHYQNGTDTLGVSHGFLYPTNMLVDGVYHAFTTFEISPLPMDKAANQFTSFERTKAMPITDAQKQEVTAILGDELAGQMFAASDAQEKAAVDSGVNFKGATEMADPEARQMIVALQGQVKDLTDAVTALAPADDKPEADPVPASPVAPVDPAVPATPVTPVAPVAPVADENVASVIAELTQGMEVMKQTMANLATMGAPASQAPQTQLPDDSKMAAWLKEQNAKQNEMPSLIQQLSTSQPMNGQ